MRAGNPDIDSQVHRGSLEFLGYQIFIDGSKCGTPDLPLCYHLAA